MAQEFSGVKEQALPDFAERFADSGFAVLDLDYQGFGESEGKPRCQLFPLDMVKDDRNAITWVCGQPGVDADCVGVWGTSYSGGLATRVATVDRRVKAVVAQVPSFVSPETLRAADLERWTSVGAFLQRDRIARLLRAVLLDEEVGRAIDVEVGDGHSTKSRLNPPSASTS